jgi:hypothetical protein
MVETNGDSKSAPPKQPREVRMAPDRPPLDQKELRILPYALAAGAALIVVLALVATIGA